MTAIMMASMGTAAVTAPVLDTTITVGNNLWFAAGTTADYFGYGYSDALADPLFTVGPIGSMGSDVYVDATATSRTISHVLYSDDTGAIYPNLEDSIFFGLVGTGIADADSTFREIEYNGITYARADRSIYEPSHGAVVTYWQWSYVNPNGPTSGTRSFKVFL